jgi:hypothetical protein
MKFMILFFVLLSCSSDKPQNQKSSYISSKGFSFDLPMKGKWQELTVNDHYEFLRTKPSQDHRVTASVGYSHIESNGVVLKNNFDTLKIIKTELSGKARDSEFHYRQLKGTHCLLSFQMDVDLGIQEKKSGMSCLIPGNENTYVWMELKQAGRDSSTFEDTSADEKLFFESLSF